MFEPRESFLYVFNAHEARRPYLAVNVGLRRAIAR